jgi:hypothetical protein
MLKNTGDIIRSRSHRHGVTIIRGSGFDDQVFWQGEVIK